MNNNIQVSATVRTANTKKNFKQMENDDFDAEMYDKEVVPEI